MAKLVNNKGVEIPLGSEVVTGSGEKATLVSFTVPHNPGSTGRVTIADENGVESSYFPTVIGAKIVLNDGRRPRYGSRVTIVSALSSLMYAYIHNKKDGKDYNDVVTHIGQICSDHLARGSGIDNGTKFLLEKSAPDKLCFQVGFHHMNENGYYDGWSHFTLVVRPSFIDPCGTMLLKGRDRDQIKEYLYDVYNADLGQIIAWDWEDGKYAKPKE